MSAENPTLHDMREIGRRIERLRDKATINEQRERIAALTAEVEALRRDAERVAFLDTVSVAIHARNGRRYEAGPGNARDIIDMAQRYHAARQQEATNGP